MAWEGKGEAWGEDLGGSGELHHFLTAWPWQMACPRFLIYHIRKGENANKSECLEPSLALMRHSISVAVINLGEHMVGDPSRVQYDSTLVLSPAFTYDSRNLAGCLPKLLILPLTSSWLGFMTLAYKFMCTKIFSGIDHSSREREKMAHMAIIGKWPRIAIHVPCGILWSY